MIAIQSQVLSLDEIVDITVSDIVEVDDTFHRTVSFWTVPSNQTGARPVLEVRVSGSEAAAIRVTAPAQEF